MTSLELLEENPAIESAICFFTATADAEDGYALFAWQTTI